MLTFIGGLFTYLHWIENMIIVSC